MEVRKVCRFLILIFVILSILFFLLYVSELKKRTVMSEDLISDAVENLSSRGVLINETDIEASVPERDILYFEIPDTNDYYEKITSSISNVLYNDGVVATEFDTPDGYSVGFYEKSGSSKELGRIMFSESDLSFVFSKFGLSMKDGNQPIGNMQTDEISDASLSVIDEVVSCFSDSKDLGYTITGSSSNDTFLIVTVMQTASQSVISDAYLNFVFSEGELVIISGSWITGTPKAKYHNTLLDGVNVLYKLNLDEVSKIENESVVYSLRKTDNNRYFIIPCWKIEFVDKAGNFVTSYFDAFK